MAVSHDDFRDVLLASSPDTCRGKSAWITIALKSGRRRRASSKSRPILVYVIGPGDDARALGCLQHVAGLARQVGSAPLRPLRDLDRRNLHAVPGADEGRSGLSRSRVESLGVFAASFGDMSMTSPTWRALGQVVLVYFGVGGAAVTAQEAQPGRATFAEMIAFARLASVPCQRLAPDADSFHALALRRLIKPPITEEEIAAKEKKTSSGFEFVSGLANGAGAMPAKWSRPVFSFRFYEGKISRALIVSGDFRDHRLPP